jgi:hypothetical protein
VGANIGENVHAIAAGQSEIEEDKVEGMLSDSLQASFAGGCGLDGEAFHLEERLQGLANLSLIIDDEYSAGEAVAAVEQTVRDYR